MILILLLLILFSTIFNGDDIVASANINLWLVLVLLCYKIFKERYVSIGSMFIFGFVYIFFNEFLNQTDFLFLEWGKNNVISGYYVSMFSFFALQLGYHFREFFNKKSNFYNTPKRPDFIKNKKIFFRLNIIFIAVIFLGNIFLIVEGLTEGRPNAFKYGILSSLSYAIALITIVNMKIYFKQYYGSNNYLKTILYTFPLFILFIASGTRFILLYGIIALVSDELVNLSNKRIIKVGIFIVFFGILSNLVLESRNDGFLNSGLTTQNITNSKNYTFNQIIVNKFTDEGMLRNAAMITDYSNKHGNTYGKSISFLTYWWVPRIIWENKPNQLDFWLIREYTNEYDDTGFSTASGFFGELYMDFGKYFLMPILFALGYYFSYLNFRFIFKNEKLNYRSVLISSSILAWIFFLVRSIMTSTFLLTFVVIAAYILNKYLKKWNIIN